MAWGVDTTLIYRGEEILRGFDWDLRTMVRQEMEKKGIRVIRQDTFSTDREKGGRVCWSGTPRQVSRWKLIRSCSPLAAKPHTVDLGLEKAGVAMDHIGAIKVSDGFSEPMCRLFMRSAM